MVAHTGFEPVISALRGRRPRPLDECARYAGLLPMIAALVLYPTLPALVKVLTSGDMHTSECSSRPYSRESPAQRQQLCGNCVTPLLKGLDRRRTMAIMLIMPRRARGMVKTILAQPCFSPEREVPSPVDPLFLQTRRAPSAGPRL